MSRRTYIIFILVIASRISFSQGIRDSIIYIEEVGITADRIFKLSDAGMTESRIDTNILRLSLSNSVSDVLSENTPVFIKSHGRGALATASFRGMAASHTKVNWNGISINNPTTGMVDFSLIPAFLIDEMSLRHGSSSIASQSGGLGGSINLNNQTNWDDGLRLKYYQGIGSYSSFDEFLNVSIGNKKVQSSTRIYHNYSANDYTFINRGILDKDSITGEFYNPIDTNDNANYKKYGLLQEFYFRPNQKNIISLKYWGQGAERTIPQATSYEGPDNSNLNLQTDNDHKLVADWKVYTKKSKLIVRSGFSSKDSEYKLLNYIGGVGLVPSIYSISSLQSYLNSADYSYTKGKSFSLEAKIDFNHYRVNTTDTITNLGYKKERTDLSAFISARKKFWNRLNVNLMFRQSISNGDFLPFIPFVGFDFRLTNKFDLILKGNIARNYHQPTLNDLYWQPGGNPDLLPEQGYTEELGLEFQRIFRTHKLKSEINYYRSDISNWILWIPSFKGYWEAQNIARVLSQGFEVNVALDGLVDKLQYKISGNYALTQALNYGDREVWGDESYGKQLVYLPVHSGNFFAQLKYKAYFVSWQFNSYSERFTTSSNDVSRRDRLYPYFMNDLILGKDFSIQKQKFSAKLKIMNVFNETYHSILYRPMPKINYMLTLSVKL